MHPDLTGRLPSERALVITTISVAAGAWLVLVALHGSSLPAPTGWTHGHGAGPALGTPSPSTASHGTDHWWLGWVLMVAAMMLPPALPLLRVVRRLVAELATPQRLVAATATSFVACWVLVGVAYYGAQLAAGQLVANQVISGRVTAGTAVLAAGAFQFTRLKQACLTACRSPVSIVTTTWTGRRPAAVEAALVGARYALVCIACCWALMLLTLVVGLTALPTMVVVATMMALERLSPEIRSLVPLFGYGVIVLGIVVLLGWVPAALVTG